MKKMIWHNKIEYPDTEEGLFVYVFDDGVDVEEFESDFFFASNLIKWAYWKKRLWDSEQLSENVVGHNFKPYKFVEFQKAYRKNPERMTFTIKKIDWLPWGLKTDLHCNEPVFDIELGRRIK